MRQRNIPPVSDTSPNTPDTFSTTSITEASFCLCVKLRLTEIREQPGFRTVFVFSGPRAREKAAEFYNGGRVCAKTFTDHWRFLRDRLKKQL